MQTVLIANPKGGSGKTTLSTNIAGYLAAQGKRVSILDLDRQKSATQWLANRPESLPEISALNENKSANHADWMVIDSPAGLHGKNLEHALRIAQRVIIPVAPSVFDIQASYGFLRALAEVKAVSKGKIAVGVVGMRMNPRTRAALTLENFVRHQEFPILAFLRETQAYVNAAFEGKSLFDLPAHLAERELEQWRFMLHWLDQRSR